MIFTPDPGAAADWWGRVLDAEVRRDVNEANGDVYAGLDAAGVEFGFHPLDEKRNRLLEAGCTHHRGPLDVGDGTGTSMRHRPVRCCVPGTRKARTGFWLGRRYQG
nr:glyoxalase/bleomycin resistance/dioxygenase family protein [Streptomyces sp. SID4923]